MKTSKIAVYVTGFVFSVALTLAAYYVVWIHVNSGHEAISHTVLVALILSLAIVQLAVQALTFLHIGSESGPRWKLGAFLSTLGLILVIVCASIWIMYHLNYNMTPTQVDQYMQTQQGGF